MYFTAWTFSDIKDASQMMSVLHGYILIQPKAQSYQLKLGLWCCARFYGSLILG